MVGWWWWCKIVCGVCVCVCTPRVCAPPRSCELILFVVCTTASVRHGLRIVFEAPPVREAPPEVPPPSTAAATEPAAAAPRSPQSQSRRSSRANTARRRPWRQGRVCVCVTTMSRCVFCEHDPDKWCVEQFRQPLHRETSWEEKFSPRRIGISSPPRPPTRRRRSTRQRRRDPGLSMAAAAEAAVAGGGLATLGADSSLAARADPSGSRENVDQRRRERQSPSRGRASSVDENKI